MAVRTSTFLGANTPRGFVSFFDELYNPYKTTNAYIIKGGPGTGKSTFMKKIGSALHLRGIDTEWVYCASDPKSLDGIIAPETGFSIADGTSPHTLEPRFPGCSENILNLGQFWNENELKQKAEKIRSLSLENSLYHRRSAGYLSAAGSVDDEIRMICSAFINEDKINSFTLRFSMRETPKKKKSEPGRKMKRFISAITPEGIVFMDDTVGRMCTRIIGIEDEYSAVSGLIMERIGENAVKNGYDVIFCHCPMRPMECEHLIIPEISLCLMTVKSCHSISIPCDRLIHAKRFLHEGMKENRSLLKFDKRLKAELINEGIEKLKKAKAVHDELEKLYIESMDFKALNEFCDEFIERTVCGMR
ncbi:MAG: hypothetical protein IJ491_01130 [Clostridia bacterium]|nr:hypothetical protein [Clostridia bacterium]